MVKEFVFDYFSDGIEVAKSKDIPLIYHSDGNVTQALDMILEMGFDAVNPMQPEFNDFCRFKEKYGDRLSVYGEIDNTKIIPYSTPKEIKEHVHWIFESLGRDGGLIMSSHDIPLCCPQDNIEVMVEAIKECHY